MSSCRGDRTPERHGLHSLNPTPRCRATPEIDETSPQPPLVATSDADDVADRMPSLSGQTPFSSDPSTSGQALHSLPSLQRPPPPSLTLSGGPECEGCLIQQRLLSIQDVSSLNPPRTASCDLTLRTLPPPGAISSGGFPLRQLRSTSRYGPYGRHRAPERHDPSSSTSIHAAGASIISSVLHSEEQNIPVTRQLPDSHSPGMQPSLQRSDGVAQCTLLQPRPVDSGLLTTERDHYTDQASSVAQSSTTAHTPGYVPQPTSTPTNPAPMTVVSPRLLSPMSPLTALPSPLHGSPSRPSPMSITRVERRFNGTSQGSTVWYESEPSSPSQFPPPRFTASRGELYRYKDADGQLNFWVMDGVWKTVGEGSSHPTIQGRRLHIRPSGEPSWLTARSYAVQKSKTVRGASTTPITVVSFLDCLTIST